MKITCAAIVLALAAFPALAHNVKITPVGSHAGELCANDRAIIFEDPTGVRFLYDPAHNVPAATIHGWARSTWCCSPTCTATTSAT